MPSPTSTQTHYRTCNLCEAMCGLKIKHADGQIISIKGDKLDQFSRGHICPKATALQDIYEDPNRLRHPVRRTADGWEQISWDEALDAVEQGIKQVQAKHGKNSVGVYLGNPNAHNVGSILYGAPFVRSLRTRNRFSASSADQWPHHFAAYFMFGHQLLLPVPDIDHTDYMLIIGGNPLASNGSIMTAPDVRNRLKAIQQRGGKVIVIDPRRTETAVLANEHQFIRPGSDVLLLLAMLNVIFADGLANPDRLAAFTDGLDQIEALAAPYTPEAVAPHTGIDAATIRRLATDYATAKTAVCYGRIGTSTQKFGGLCHWLLNVLSVVTGNLDRRGGMMFTTPAFDVVGITQGFGNNGRHNRWQSRVRKLPEFSGELPVSTLAEEILTAGDGQVKAMVTIAGNPILSTPNGRQLDQAFESLEFMVAIDIYINETTRHADIILPTTTGLETEQYDVVFHYLAVRNTAKYAPALFPPSGDLIHEWELFRELRNRFEGVSQADRTTPRGKHDYFRRFTPSQIIDLALRFGPYGYQGKKITQGEGLKLRTLQENPHGVDLGPLVSMLPGRLGTENGRIHLTPPVILQDLPRVQKTFFGEDAKLPNLATPQPLTLIGRRDLRSNNSWMHNSQRLVRGKNRCTLLIHPADAAQREITSGDNVTITSRVGSVQLEAELTDTMMPGVVSIPHGWGHGRDGVQLTVAQANAGISLNDLTDEEHLDALTGNAGFSGVPVSVHPA